jgi:hypothetical protein
MNDHHAMVAPLAIGIAWSASEAQLRRPTHGVDVSSIHGVKDEPDEPDME